MSESHEDNLNSEYQEKNKRKAKRGSRRGLVGGLALIVLFGLGVLMYFALRPVPKTVMEFAVMPYPTFPVPSNGFLYAPAGMQAIDGGFRVVTYTQNGLERTDHYLENNIFCCTEQFWLSDSNFYSPLAISPLLDIVYTDSGYTTTIISSDDVRQTIALNSPVRTNFSGDGTRFAISNPTSNIVVYNSVSRSVIIEIKVTQIPDYYPYAISLNYDGSRLLVAGNSLIQVYDLSGQVVSSIPSDWSVSTETTVALSTGEWISAAYQKVLVFNGESVTRHFIGDSNCQASAQVKRTSDDKLLAILANHGGNHSVLCIIDIPTLLSLQDGEDIEASSFVFDKTAPAMAFSSDNQTIGVYTLGNNNQPQLYVVDLTSMTIVASTETIQP